MHSIGVYDAILISFACCLRQTLRDAESWLRNYKYHNQCDGYLTSLTELLTIMSRFVGTVNPAFGTSSVESVDVRTK